MLSPLCNVVRLSPNCSKGRRGLVVDGFAIHCEAGNLSAETAGWWFGQPSTKASCNYAVASDGRITGIVDEDDTSWCTSNVNLDRHLITIEVANCGGAPDWPVTPQAYQALINLLYDCCVRHGIRQLLWKADKSLMITPGKQNMVAHRWVANKACPGDYLYNRFGNIAGRVNTMLDQYYNPKNEEEPEMVEPRFNTITEIKQAHPWALETMKKLTTDAPNHSALLHGDGTKDENGFYQNFDLSLDMIRMFVVNDRAGLYSYKD